MSFKLNNTKSLDYKQCYDLYVKERLSIYKIPEKLAVEGIINSHSSSPVTPQAVWRAAWMYALENIAEAKRDMEAIFRQRGMILRDEDFYREIITKARQFYTGKKYQNYIEQHPYLRPYV